jgi:hypothetical protein
VLRIVVVGEVPRRVLGDLISGYGVHVSAQIGPDDAVADWGKAALGQGAYRAVLVGRGLSDALEQSLERLAERRDVQLVRHTMGMDAPALARALGARAVKAAPAFVISFNNKGGTGKSTLAVNAAVRLAALGYRVLAVDDDAQNGDVAPYFGLDGDDIPHLGELLGRQDRRLEPQDVQSLVVAAGRGVDVLAAPPTPTGPGPTVPQVWELAMALVELPYEVVFIDSPPGLTEGTLTQTLLHEGLVRAAMLPFTDDRGGLKGLREARTLMLARIPPERILAVLMRIRPDVLAEPAQIPELRGLEVLEVPYYKGLMHDPVLSPDGGGGIKTLLRAIFGWPGSEAALAFESLGRRLVRALALTPPREGLSHPRQRAQRPREDLERPYEGMEHPRKGER